MGFVWGALAVGDKVLYSASVQLDEMRDNADWLNDNQANRTYNATVDATADVGYDATLLTSQLNGQNSGVNSSNYGSNYPANYPGYCACNGK
jgi:hypothetical protein